MKKITLYTLVMILTLAIVPLCAEATGDKISFSTKPTNRLQSATIKKAPKIPVLILKSDYKQLTTYQLELKYHHLQGYRLVQLLKDYMICAKKGDILFVPPEMYTDLRKNGYAVATITVKDMRTSGIYNFGNDE